MNRLEITALTPQEIEAGFQQVLLEDDFGEPDMRVAFKLSKFDVIEKSHHDDSIVYIWRRYGVDTGCLDGERSYPEWRTLSLMPFAGSPCEAVKQFQSMASQPRADRFEPRQIPNFDE